MHPQKPVFTPSISFGNLIQTAVLLFGMAGGYFMLDARSQQNMDQIDELKRSSAAQSLSIETRVRSLEVARARDDERFSNILTFMGRIDARLERIENKD